MVHTWRCRRTKDKVVCDTLMLARKQKCTTCGAPRPKRKPPAHRAVLDLPYEWWVERFGTTCNICGAPPAPGKRLYKEHEHKGEGELCARGLACFQCNRKLGNKSAVWLRKAASYLERHEERKREAGKVVTLDSAPEAPINQTQTEQHEDRKRDAA